MIETLGALSAGFANALTLPHLLWALAGATLGTAVGVLPGIGPALTVAVLLPITFTLDPISAFIMFGGIYYGAMYGGSTTRSTGRRRYARRPGTAVHGRMPRIKDLGRRELLVRDGADVRALAGKGGS